ERDSAMHLAVRKGNMESFQVLMEKNARIELENNLVQNVLHTAVSSTTSNPEIVEKLVEKMKQTCSPFLNSQDIDGNTALHLAGKYSKADLVQLLSDLDPEIENQDGETPLHVAVRYGTIREVEAILETFYSSKRTNIDHKDELGRSALFTSAENGDVEMFELLLSHGANMTLRNNVG
ncbi:hypothetical protein HELRODRAFT_144489, partial [Helobdella robusta]|uniref:Uncharacterized protein n=1 Tax=Helobdella robusta TaxID=6412 RepID=T1EJF2_HELRO